MELKNAVAVCLISLFSATLVVLIARSLDSQAASRLEPQLAQIVTELQALRKSGRIAAKPNGAGESEPADDCLMVYYFHNSMRCPDCLAVEAQTREIVQSDFASQVAGGEVVWKVLNFEKPAVEGLAEKFEIYVAAVVLAKYKDGQIEDWKRLDRARVLVNDKPAFAEYVREEIRQMLGAADPPSAPAPPGNAPEIPIPDVAPPDIPVPAAPAGIPVPE